MVAAWALPPDELRRRRWRRIGQLRAGVQWPRNSAAGRYIDPQLHMMERMMRSMRRREDDEDLTSSRKTYNRLYKLKRRVFEKPGAVTNEYLKDKMGRCPRGRFLADMASHREDPLAEAPRSENGALAPVARAHAQLGRSAGRRSGLHGRDSARSPSSSPRRGGVGRGVLAPPGPDPCKRGPRSFPERDLAVIASYQAAAKRIAKTGPKTHEEGGDVVEKAPYRPKNKK
jgi:hypothetical protein